MRANRRPAAADNPLLGYERMASELIAGGLDAWGKARDALTEEIFLGVYGAPWLQAMVGLSSDDATRKRGVERDLAREAAELALAAHLAQRVEGGGLVGAAVRALLYVRLPDSIADERGFAALREIASELPAAKRLGLARFKELVREQFLILRLDEERAIAALPKLLPEDPRACQNALSLIRRVLDARGAPSDEGVRRLQRVEALLGAAPVKAVSQPKPALTGI